MNPGTFAGTCDHCKRQLRAGDVQTVERETLPATRLSPAEWDRLRVCGSCHETLTRESEPDPDVERS